MRRDPAAIRTLFPAVGRKVGRAPLRPEADPQGLVHGTVDDLARTRLLAVLAEVLDATLLAAEVAQLYRYGDDAERRGVLRGLAALPAAAVPAGTRTRQGRLARQRHPARRRRHGRVRPPGTSTTTAGATACSSACSSACRSPRSSDLDGAPTPSCCAWSATTPRNAGPPAARSRRRRRHCWRPAREDLRPAHPHDLADHRRLRGDVRRRRARARRAGVLARPAAHQRRVVHRLLRQPHRLGAVPRRAVRHPPPLHDRAEPQGGQRPALRARCSTCCRATSRRTAWSRSARSATTR